MDDECAVKHCENDATLGMTWNIDGIRVEFYVCERHFDAITSVSTPTRPEPTHVGDGIGGCAVCHRRWPCPSALGFAG